MSFHAVRDGEPIPGYRLTKRIGAGGYGEVWEAEAPGGLTKAIKFVYGRLDDDRAARELKSLNRIKTARHPFLLSLERIEVVDGQLVIVTELAEGSLKDRFDAYKNRGATGIPREELLLYLRDTADALDYMSESHSLQHLDVKPENLLMLGGRVKVADFGLVKELHDVTASMMGGLTPLYAPPEVYDGRPSRFSDQYSLAIVYQEMLTGVLPFTGSTAAQLATQHFSAAPRISVLPIDDQPAIARALSKNPVERFANCRGLVENLLHAGKVHAAPASEHRPSESGGNVTAPMTSAHPRTPPAPQQCYSRNEPETPSTPLKAASCRPLPPLELPDQPLTLRPLALVGIGGVATGILGRFRRLLNDHMSSADSLPTIGELALDTDARALSQATQAASGGALRPNQTLHIGLRRPQDYKDSALLLKTISRRWLYNIPRSQQTEGLRPLGRLAMLDHAGEIRERVRKLILEVIDEHSAALTERLTRAQLRLEAPRVVLLASASGGAGGGMAAEMGYMLREVTQELGLDEAEISAVLVHGSGRNPTAKDLAMANTYACLNEIHHYSRGSRVFPGDEACGLAPNARPPFDHVYFEHFGDDLSDEQFEQGADKVARFLFYDAVTPAARFFQASRDESRALDVGAQALSLRSFGLCQLGGAHGGLLKTVSSALRRRLLQTWRGEKLPVDGVRDTNSLRSELTAVRRSTSRVGLAAAEDAEVSRSCVQLAEQLGLTFEKISLQAACVIRTQLEGDGSAFFEQLTGESINEHGDAFGQPLLETITAIVGPRKADCPQEDLQKSPLGRAIHSALRDKAQEQANVLLTFLDDVLDTAPGRLRSAMLSLDALSEHLRLVSETSKEITDALEHDLTAAQVFFMPDFPGEAGRNRPRSAPAPDRVLQRARYFQLRLQTLTMQAVRGHVKIVSTRLNELKLRMRDLQRDLSALDQRFAAETPPAPSQASPQSELQAALQRRLYAQFDDLTVRLDAAARTAGIGSLKAMLTGELSLKDRFCDQLAEAARSVTLAAFNEIDVTAAFSAGNPAAQQRLEHCLKEARPLLTRCGGGERLLLLLPESGEQSDLRDLVEELSQNSPTVLLHAANDAVACYEVQGLSLPHVALQIVHQRADLVQVAERLHTRKDINWTPCTAQSESSVHAAH